MLFSIVSKTLRRALAAALLMTTASGFAFSAEAGLSKVAMDKLVESDQVLARIAENSGKVRVIVEFGTPTVASAESASAEALDEAQTLAVHQKQDEILGRVFSTQGGLSGALASDDLGIKRMDFSPMFAATVDQETLEKLAADPAVVRIHEDALAKPDLLQSLPLIGMPNAYAAGATGNGWYVAVLDTGARRTHEFLISSVASAACYSTTNSTYPSFSYCPGGVSASTDINSAMDCDEATIAGCGHGTHTSGTAAGFNTSQSSGEPTNGVARNGKLITINVFSRFTTTANCGSNIKSNGCVLSFSSDQIKGLERVYALRNTYNIGAASMSLGGGQHFSACDTNALKPIIDQLRAAGIATVIAAGNDGFNTSVGAPGCISSAITVASSTKSDVRSSFSNWGTLIDVVAPGSAILAPYLNGASNSFYASLNGTSMATPHVAGAFAALKSAKPAATVSQIETALETTGVAISSSGTTKPRIKVDSALTALGGSTAKAVMTSPTPGSTLGSSATFVWTTGSGVSQYWLYVGSTGVGSSNIWNASNGTSTTRTVTGLPSTGTIYVRLWSLISGSWQSNDYTYKTGGGTKAVMTSPTPGSTLGSSATFVWTTGTNVSQYWLYVGSTGVGSSNIYQAGQGTSTTRTVTGLPSTGTIYVRLWSYISGSWQWNDYTYKTGGGTKAVMTSPTPGSTLGSSATFVWTTGTNVSQYWLYVGSTGVGSSNIYQAGQGTSTTRTVTGLPSTGTIYVRLWSLISGSWQSNDYTYKTGGGTKAVMTSPTPGSTLGSSATFIWTTGSGVSQYWLYVGSTGVGSYNIYQASQGTSTTRTVTGLPSTGTIYVRLWSYISGSWQWNDYTYKAGGGTKAVMTSPTPGSTLGSSATFVWTTGSGVSQYWLYVGSTGVGSYNIYQASQGTSTTRTVTGLPSTGTIYVRLWSYISGSWQWNDYTYKAGGTAKAVMTSPTPGSTLGSSATFVWTTGSGVSQYWLYVGSTGVGSFNIYQASQGTSTSKTVTGLPSTGTIYVRLWSLISGSWQWNDYTYKAGGGGTKSVLLSPANGSKLATSQKFTWSAVSGATQYWINFGSTVGGSNYYNASQGTATTTTLNFNNFSGQAIYMRLWTLYNGAWAYNDYNFIAPGGTTGASVSSGSGTPSVSVALTQSSLQ
ncbi:S8 family serine peptidase [Aquibium sp. LZ166]|uniref:S8 family serine peptidase n=1 Tax=Aquibium pacificus TaxID=3153579 RepID=A0ABV3SL12_9HYPH